ncbi:MAG: hypothetical protein ACXV95_12130 [Acidimicrobiales bacterium]
MTQPHADVPGTPVGRPSGYRVPLARPKPPARVRPPRPTRPGSSGWGLLGVLLVLAALALYALGEWVFDRSTGAGLIVAPVMVAVVFFTLRRKVALETRFDLGGLLLTSLGLRLLFAYPRFGSATDAVIYNREGARLADSFRSLNFTNVDVGAAASVPGTGSLRYIAGLVHLTTGSSFFGTTLVFGLMAFAGCWLFYRAFQLAIPDGDHYRYAKLIFLWPSLLYWPSSIGKDSWMLLTIAIASLGAARLLTRTRGGYALIFVGLVGSALVRPHVTLLVFVAIGIAFIIGRRDTNRIPGQVSLGGVTKVIGIVVLLVAGSLLAPATAHFLKLDDLSGDSVSNAIEATQLQTGEGGSAFSPSNPNSPIGYPIAVVTVLFRPLPGEVTNAQGLFSGAEGGLLLVITALSWRRIWGAVTRLRSQPYVTYAAAYLAMFAYAFAAIANFGILARERVQLIPLFFVLLAVPPARRRDPEDRASAPSSGTASSSRSPAR